jgi:hypothetical protein
MASIHDGTKKITTAVDVGLSTHQKACFERLDVLFVRRRPGLVWSIFGVTMLTIAGILNAYWVFEGDQNSRQAIVETKVEQVEKQQGKIDALIDGQNRMVDMQREIINEMRKYPR